MGISRILPLTVWDPRHLQHIELPSWCRHLKNRQATSKVRHLLRHFERLLKPFFKWDLSLVNKKRRGVVIIRVWPSLLAYTKLTYPLCEKRFGLQKCKCSRLSSHNSSLYKFKQYNITCFINNNASYTEKS